MQQFFSWDFHNLPKYRKSYSILSHADFILRAFKALKAHPWSSSSSNVVGDSMVPLPLEHQQDLWIRMDSFLLPCKFWNWRDSLVPSEYPQDLGPLNDEWIPIFPLVLSVLKMEWFSGYIGTSTRSLVTKRWMDSAIFPHQFWNRVMRKWFKKS